eukprot:TRINITY_DN5964_c0_g1_i2.p2 TRINITY_DN5964_c0_g1~~TRINITY_DN5964_c0_g1_i2.p2  ORF type:complete len:164 (+),score=29.82 TRINITY_DN5964_c0_g1_i2:721-1212(+)
MLCSLVLICRLALYQVIVLVRNYEVNNEISDSSASSLNLAVSDGQTVVVCRYRNSVEELPPSLFYCPVKQFSMEEDTLVIESDYQCNPMNITTPLGVIVASEPLTEDQVWIELQPFTIAVIQPGEGDTFHMNWSKLGFSPNNEDIDNLADLLNVPDKHIVHLE